LTSAIGKSFCPQTVALLFQDRILR